MDDVPLKLAQHLYQNPWPMVVWWLTWFWLSCKHYSLFSGIIWLDLLRQSPVFLHFKTQLVKQLQFRVQVCAESHPNLCWNYCMTNLGWRLHPWSLNSYLFWDLSVVPFFAPFGLLYGVPGQTWYLCLRNGRLADCLVEKGRRFLGLELGFWSVGCDAGALRKAAVRASTCLVGENHNSRCSQMAWSCWHWKLFRKNELGFKRVYRFAPFIWL